jgi:hypothetical protein
LKSGIVFQRAVRQGGVFARSSLENSPRRCPCARPRRKVEYDDVNEDEGFSSNVAPPSGMKNSSEIEM